MTKKFITLDTKSGKKKFTSINAGEVNINDDTLYNTVNNTNLQINNLNKNTITALDSEITTRKNDDQLIQNRINSVNAKPTIVEYDTDVQILKNQVVSCISNKVLPAVINNFNNITIDDEKIINQV